MHRLWGLGAAAVLAVGTAGADEQQHFGNWTVATFEDAETYEVVSALWQDSANSIKDEYARKDVVPRLSFRCRPGEPTVIARIGWGRFISSFNTELGFKVDDGKRKWLKWGVDRSEQTTISPSAADTQTLLELVANGAKLVVEISPYSEGPVNAAFELDGIGSALEALQASCQ
jgi:hypothetical protein